MVTIFYKILGVHFGNSVLDISNWDKIGYNLTKTKQKKYLEQSATLFEMKKEIVNQPLIQTLIYRQSIYYSKI